MLRSLVGSEMCIRDRIVGIDTDAVATDQAGAEGQKIPLRSGCLKNLERCLLYTSDAADDPLCVDLGGRRNINKKNKHTQQIFSFNN